MKKYFLLIALLLIGVANYAAIIEGTVTDQSNAPVPNRDVFVTDTLNGPSPLLLQATTDANGYYSVNVPLLVANGTELHVYTAGCNGATAMNTYIFAGVDITSDFVVCTFVPPFAVSGTVSLTPATGAYPATVYMIGVQPDTVNSSYELILIDSTTTNAQGEYSMGYPNTSYYRILVKAALQASSPDYSNYLPTYFASSPTWDLATDIGTLANPTGNVNFALIQGVNPGGPGFIAGLVIQGANKTTGPGDPLDKKILILTDVNDVPVAYTYSDANGLFAFPSLAYGTYKIFGDVWGKLNPPLLVTISASQPSVNDVEFEENSTSFDGHIGITAVNSVSANLSKLVLYPNPVTDLINVEGLNNISGDKHITVTDLKGSVISSVSCVQGEKVSVPMAGTPAGLYLLKISTKEGVASFKVVK
jgi:hypothetical protein